MSPSPGPPLPPPFLACQPDNSVLRALLTLQALDAIERGQDLAEEVGNKVRPDSVSWGWSQEPKVGLWAGREGPRSPLLPRGLPNLQELPSHPQTPAVSLPPREQVLASLFRAEFLRTFLMAIKTPHRGLHSLRDGLL